MAQTVILTDDIDGSGNAETVRFSFDGQSYTIDLAKKNRAAFEKALKPYISAASRMSASSRRPARRRPTSGRRSGPALADVRAWAAEQGIEVSERGRIAQSVMEAYGAAH